MLDHIKLKIHEDREFLDKNKTFDMCDVQIPSAAFIMDIY